MKNLLIAVAALFFGGNVWAAAPAPAPATPKAEEYATVTAKGEAAVNHNLPAAKEKAKEAAMREAVNQVVGTFVTSQSESKDFTLVRDVVFAHSEGYVRKVEVLSEKVEDDVVTTTIRAEVGKGAVDKDVAAVRSLIAMKGQRRVYVAIDDIGTSSAKNATVVADRHGEFDAKLRDILRADGFTCIDPNIADNKLKSKSSVQSLSTTQEALEIGNIVGADIVIYGHVTGQSTEGDAMGTKMFNVVLSGSVTVAATDSAESLGDVVVKGSAGDLIGFAKANSIAMDKAATEAGATIRSKLYEAWRKHQTGAQHVVIAVSGLKDFTAFGAFKELLKSNVRGVKDVYSGSFQKGSATMEIALAGNVETLAAELENKNFKGQIVHVSKATNNTLELALGK